MGRIIKPDEVCTQANETISALQSHNEALHKVLPNITLFMNNEVLAGNAWNSVKNQMSNHELVVQGLICANDQAVMDNETLMSQAGDEELIEDDIEQAIAESENSISQCQNNIAYYQQQCVNLGSLDLLIFAPYIEYAKLQINYNELLINNLEKFIQAMKDKIAKIDSIEAATNDLFLSAKGLYSDIDTGMSVIQGAWNGSGFTISENTSWKSSLRNAWDAREVRLRNKVFNSDGTLKEAFVQEISNKSMVDMTPEELEMFNLMIERILSEEVTVKELTMVIDCYYTPEFEGQRRRKDTAVEFGCYIDSYVEIRALCGDATRGEMQRAMLFNAVFSHDSFGKLGEVNYDSTNNVYTFRYSNPDNMAPGGTITSYKWSNISVGLVGYQDQGTDIADQNGDYLLSGLLGFDISESIRSTIVLKATSKCIQNAAKSSINQPILSKILPELVPSGIGAVISYAEGIGIAGQGKKIAEIDDCGLALSNLDLFYSSAFDGNVYSYKSQIYPSQNTMNLINGFNEYLDNDNKISYSELRTDPNGVAEKLKSLEILSVYKDKIIKKLGSEYLSAEEVIGIDNE